MKKIQELLANEGFMVGDILDPTYDNHGSGYPAFMVENYEMAKKCSERKSRYALVYRQFPVSEVRELTEENQKLKKELEIANAKLVLLKAGEKI